MNTNQIPCERLARLNYRLVHRLETYRKRAAECAVNNPAYAAGKTWRDFRYGAGKGIPFGTQLAGRGEKGERYTDSIEQYGDLVFSSEKDSRDNMGWYADNFQDSLIRFGVVRINTAKGRLYVAVTWNTDADGATYYFRDSELVPKSTGRADSYGDEHSHDETIQTVARWADRCAEIEAEECREEDAKYQAEQQTERLTEEIESNRKELRLLLHERRGFRREIPECQALCLAVTEKARRLIREIRYARERIGKLAKNYWEAVEC